jgi:hypothetical protein
MSWPAGVVETETASMASGLGNGRCDMRDLGVRIKRMLDSVTDVCGCSAVVLGVIGTLLGVSPAGGLTGRIIL